jgi:hypothetical protein
MYTQIYLAHDKFFLSVFLAFLSDAAQTDGAEGTASRSRDGLEFAYT